MVFDGLVMVSKEGRRHVHWFKPDASSWVSTPNPGRDRD